MSNHTKYMKETEMPTYEYKCNKCKKPFSISGTYETLFSYTPVCPHCGSKDCKKVIGKVNFILKGSDFYKNSQ